MNDFFTWEILMSYSGCMLGTTLLTQFVKNFGFLKNIENQIISFIIALIIMIVGALATGTFTVNAIGLDIVNAVVISLASNGLYDGASTVYNKFIKKEEE